MAEADKKVRTDLTPEEQGQIEAAVLGKEDLKGLHSPETVNKIVNILKTDGESFIDGFEKIEKLIDEMELSDEEKDQIDRRITAIIANALIKNRDKIIKKRSLLKTDVDKKMNRLRNNSYYKKTLKGIQKQFNEGTIDANQAKAMKKALEKKFVKDGLDKDTRKKLPLIKSLDKLIWLIKNTPTHIDDIRKQFEEYEKSAKEEDGAKVPDDKKSGVVKPPETDAEKKKEEEGKKAEGDKKTEDDKKPGAVKPPETEEERKKKEAEAAAAEEERKKKEAMEAAKGVAEKSVSPKGMKVPDPVDRGRGNGVFENSEDIKKAQMKWAAVENDLGRPPREGDLLFWKPTKEGEEPEALNADDTERYRAFMKFMEGVADTERKIQEELATVKISLEKTVDGKKVTKNPNELNREIADAAETLLRKLLAERDKTMTALLFHVLKVNRKPEAFEKLQNIIHFQTTVDVPGKYALYEEAVNEKGEAIMVSLDDFLARHKEYGEKMITDSYEILEGLHTKYGDTYGDIEGLRDVLIEVIKTRGGKDLDVEGKKVAKSTAMEMYTYLLLALDPHTSEKEMLALLIAFRARPPFVYDLTNTTNGWELGNKKTGMHVLKDFAIDGSIYIEVKNKLGVSGSELNKFLIKIAPWFEKIRSLIASKKEGEEVKPEEISAFLPDFTAGDLALFNKLMTIQRWPDKVGHAFKYAKYLSDADIYVPLIKETQGPVTREINVTFVNVEEKLRRIAGRLADERLDQELKELGPQGWKELWRMDKIAAKWWKRNAMEGYREKYREDYIKRLKENPTYRTELMGLPRPEVKPGGIGAKMSAATPAAGTRDNINADLDAIAEKFGIAWEEGDTESYLTENERTPEALANVAIQEAIRDLCKDFENDTVDEAGFRDRVRNNIVPMIQAMQDPPDSAVVAFLEESGSTKADIDKLGLLDKMKAHKAGLIALDLDNMKINLRLGRAMNVDVKTQVKNLGWLDRASRSVVERAQKNKFLGRFISPATIAVVGYGLGNVIGQLATSSTVRAATLLSLGLAAPSLAPALAGVAGACLVGGAFAGMRQRKEVLGLKAMKERRDALGYAPADDTKGLPLSKIERDMESQDVLYGKESASVLINNITTAPDYNARIAALADAIVRNEISEMGVSATEQERVDLIKFDKDSDTTVEKQRFALLRAISQGKIDARGTNPSADADLAAAVAARRDAIIAQMRGQESKFNRLKRWETLKAAGVGAAIAGVISGAAVLISHYSGALSETTSKTVNLTPAGPLDKAGFENSLLAYGISKPDATKIMGMLKFDAAGNLDPAVAASIKSQFGIDVTGMLTPGGMNLIPVSLNGGMQMNQADLILEVHAINPTISSQIHFGADGKLTPASIALLRANNFNVTEHVSSTAGTGTVPFTPGPDWTTISKIHFNDNMPHTPGWHVLDELKLWWNGRPALGSDGNYHFTVKDMFNPNVAHSHLPPGVTMPADPTSLKIGMQMKVGGKNYWKFFTPDSSGDIKIPPSYFDQASIGPVPRGDSVLPGLKTDAMAVMFDDKNGTTQVLASVRGQGGFSPPTESVYFTGEFIKPEKLPDITALNATATTEEVNAWAAAVPVAGAPMKHLEYGKVPVTPPPPTYYNGSTPSKIRKKLKPRPLVPTYSGTSFETIHDRLSPGVDTTGEHAGTPPDLLHVAPSATRTVDSERKKITDYLDNLSPEWKDHASKVAEQMPPMDEKCRVSVNIPAYREEAIIYNMLEEYTKQVDADGKKLNPSVYEINVLVNMEEGDTPDRTVEEVKRFSADHPEFKINVANIVFPKGKGGVGAARKALTDAVLQRSTNRLVQSGPLYIESEDADHTKVDRKTVVNLIEKFDNNPQIDALRGVQDRTPEIMMQNDLFFLSRRAWDFGEIEMRRQKYRPESSDTADFTWNRVITGGWNTAYTAESYALINGYDPDMKMGEDMYIGQAISVLRGSTEADGKFKLNTSTIKTVKSRTDSSPRRFLMSFIAGKGPYDDFGNTDKEKELRAKKMEDLLVEAAPYAELNEANKPRLEQELRVLGNFMMERTPDEAAFRKSFGRVLFFLGFKKGDFDLSITKDADGKNHVEIKVNKIDNVKAALEDYKKDPKYKKRYAKQDAMGT